MWSHDDELASFLLSYCRDGLAWEVKAGQVFRIVCTDGPQVADVNFWSLHNPKERFYASKTRQLHASHLKKYDRWARHLWNFQTCSTDSSPRQVSVVDKPYAAAACQLLLVTWQTHYA
jgi:uncharacterized protein YcgI (DUF1989 family)